ncbi:prolyl oligopeptidase family serine peptidase [Streptomyces sp. NPDC060194]|uniref:S9 family peptidase n=1 Tax=Streptomyces sp. NPDC060194 TaxID=3347069 RepID=UPI0036683C3C
MTSFPRMHARTQRFTLGTPHSFALAPDGRRVAFLRSRSGTDRTHLLWTLDVADGKERVAADPEVLLGGEGEELSAAERARRERSRTSGAGIVSYATDAASELAAFALSGRLFVAELRAGTTRELPAAGPVVDPRPSPDGRHVAYAAQGALRVAGADGTGDRALAEPEAEHVTYGLAGFIDAEEIHRLQGYWWSPDSDRLLVERVDESPVRTWWIADPAHPDRPPVPVRYPAAGTPNAEVGLSLHTLDGGRTEVAWDRERYPYLARVHWSAAGPPLLLVQARDQREQVYLTVDVATGRTAEVLREEDREAWLQLHPGVPAWTPDGELVRIADRDGVRVLDVGGRALTGPDLHVRALLGVSADGLLFTAKAGEAAADPETGQTHVYSADLPAGRVRRLSEGPGVHGALRAGGTTLLVSTRLDTAEPHCRVVRAGEPDLGIGSHAEPPGLTPRVTLMEGGTRRLPCAVLLPSGYRPETDGPLPVLLDPYGGPGSARVVADGRAFLASQWFADQGFAVLVADGRGTPHHSPGFEKAVRDRLAAVTLDDQVHALHALAAETDPATGRPRFPLDLTRVAIRGWSFGGYLAGLAALRRPDVFHAAVVGAPVTDVRLYDTHYQERYLGHPDEQPEVYATNSLVTDAGLSEAAATSAPMMIVHGLADDNVVVAHSLRLSSALLAAGRRHEVLPLSGVTHMTPQEEVAENLLLLQADFLRRTLGLPRRSAEVV